MLRGPAWVVCVGALLAGIVFLNISLLQVNGDISHASQRASALKRENAELRLRVAKLGSSDRLQREAAAQGFRPPKADQVTYLESKPGADARAAARALDERAESAAAPAGPSAETAGPAPTDPAG